MIINQHKTPDSRLILTICDEELIGKKFEENNLQLDLSSNFYKGKKINETEIIELIKKASIINIVGKKSIEFCIKNDVINKESVIKVENIPHAQAIL